MSNHVRELTNQANELTTDELEHVSGGFNFGTSNGHTTPKSSDGERS